MLLLRYREGLNPVNYNHSRSHIDAKATAMRYAYALPNSPMGSTTNINFNTGVGTTLSVIESVLLVEK
ncbi:hypothetical protein HS7_00400 [Sulfolobales archaeon HS-7]|nr:hypothetical protein HS7_00400 [Sulfolobales archaeon HS-7]